MLRLPMLGGLCTELDNCKEDEYAKDFFGSYDSDGYEYG